MSRVVALTLSEADFQRRVTDLAAVYGWHCVHYRPARTARGWATPLQGDPGAPDLLLARDGVVLCVELKRQAGALRPAQRDWLTALGANGRCWRPSDWDEIVATLRGAA